MPNARALVAAPGRAAVGRQAAGPAVLDLSQVHVRFERGGKEASV